MLPSNMKSRTSLLVTFVAAATVLGACTDSRDGAQRELQQRIGEELAGRDDIPEADKAAAAAAIAQDLTDVARDSAVLQSEVDAENERLQARLGSAAQLAAADCERQLQELDALRRLAADPDRERLGDAERAALPGEIERLERERADRCSS